MSPTTKLRLGAAVISGIAITTIAVMSFGISQSVESGGVNKIPGIDVTGPFGVHTPVLDAGIVISAVYTATDTLVWDSNSAAADGTTGYTWDRSVNLTSGNFGCWRANNTVEIACLTWDGRFTSSTPATLATLYTNSINNAATYGGIFKASPFTVTNVSVYVANVAGTGTNDVIRITDGSNNCDATFSCTSDLNTTGVKNKTPTGTCAFGPNSSLVISETTGGCTPDPLLKVISFTGKNQ